MILSWEGHTPKLGQDVFVAESATVLGQVSLGAQASVWYGCVLRGDVGVITVGARTNIQDLSVVHVTTDRFDCHVGDDVTVGHRVILHGCTIAEHVLVGMGAVVMDGVEVGPWSFIGAGALVTPGTKVPPGSLVLGSPAKVVRPVNDKERGMIEYGGSHYIDIARSHARSARPVG